MNYLYVVRNYEDLKKKSEQSKPHHKEEASLSLRSLSLSCPLPV